MAEALKRLGGGRWQTKDERFTVEPQSGTWALVDAEQTDELGLPLVRGPFPSLTAAKEAIEAAREGAPAASPLAERLREAGTKGESAPERRSGPKQKKTAASSRRPGASEPADSDAEPEPPESEPPEPKWLRDLPAKTRREASALIERLTDAGIADAEAVARSEIADDEPAVARAALERRLAQAAEAGDARAAVRAVIDALLEGRDRELDARWQIVDGDGREIRRLELPAARKKR
jgi:hypothetical protein